MNHQKPVPISMNAIGCEAITNKLTEVSRIAESLDHVLRDTQHGLELTETNSSSSEKKMEGSSSNIEDWNSSIKSSKSSTEDESFITASECTCTPQSRSSSYHTTSECRNSPWWESERNSFDADTSDIDPEIPPLHLFSGLLSNNASFDESEHSFLSAQRSPILSEPIDSDDAKKTSDTLSQDSLEDKEEILVNKLSNDSLAQVKVSNDEKCNSRGNPAWSGYYQSLIAKRTMSF